MIRINDKYAICIEDQNYILVRLRIAGEKSKHAGTEQPVTLGYYSSFESVLKGALKAVEMDTLDSVDFTLREALKAVTAIRDSYGELLKKVLEYREG